MQKDYDVIVVGGGPGGYTAAIRAAQLGLKTACVEAKRLGGVCLNWGCIPTKALLRNAELWWTLQHAGEFGISFEKLEFDFNKIIQRSRDVANRLSKGVSYLFKKNKVDHVEAYGTFTSANTLELLDTEGKKTGSIFGKHIIIATGAHPRSVPGVIIDRKRVITSTEAMTLDKVPESMLIIGAGAIGVEFAYFYNALGTKVTLVEMLPHVLPLEDEDVSKELERSFRKMKIGMRVECKVTAVETGEDDVRVTVEGKSGAETLSVDLVLVAVGVEGNVNNFGLEKIGVKVEKDRIPVDASYRTNVPGVYAIGDVIGPPWLAHVASAEGIVCVETIAGKDPAPVNYDNIPACTYCQPQVASVGMTEAAAKEAGHEVRVGKFPFTASGKAIAFGHATGFVKLVFDAKYGDLLGAHIIGPEATELIAEVGLARTLEATEQEIMKTVHAHPTLAEAIMEAAADSLGEAINF